MRSNQRIAALSHQVSEYKQLALILGGIIILLTGMLIFVLIEAEEKGLHIFELMHTIKDKESEIITLKRMRCPSSVYILPDNPKNGTELALKRCVTNHNKLVKDRWFTRTQKTTERMLKLMSQRKRLWERSERQLIAQNYLLPYKEKAGFVRFQTGCKLESPISWVSRTAPCTALKLNL